MCFFFSSRRRQTRCALVTGVQTCALPISQYIELGSLHQGRWQALEALDRGLQWRGIDLGALFRVGRVVVPEPLYQALAEEVPLGEQLGRAACRERVCQYVYISVVAVSIKTKTNRSQQI